MPRPEAPGRGGFPLPRLPVAPGLWPPHSQPPPHTASPLSLRLLLSAVYGTHVSLDLRAPWPIQDDLTQTHFCKTPFFHVGSQCGCRWTWLRGSPPLNPPQPLSEAFSKQMSVFSFICVILYSEKQIFPATPPRGGASQSVVQAHSTGLTWELGRDAVSRSTPAPPNRSLAPGPSSLCWGTPVRPKRENLCCQSQVPSEGPPPLSPVSQHLAVQAWGARSWPVPEVSPAPPPHQVRRACGPELCPPTRLPQEAVLPAGLLTCDLGLGPDWEAGSSQMHLVERRSHWSRRAPHPA